MPRSKLAVYIFGELTRGCTLDKEATLVKMLQERKSVIVYFIDCCHLKTAYGHLLGLYRKSC